MADKLKPYDPNKGFISFKLDPDAIIEGLGNLIPYRNTIGMIDSEAPWSEVGKSALNETPFLGSILRGDYGDAVKEAFLLGTPVKAPAKFKKDLSKLPKTTQYKQEGRNSIRAYDPVSNRRWSIDVDPDHETHSVYMDYSYNPANFIASSKPSYTLKQVNEFIKNSNSLHKLNKTGRRGDHPLSIVNYGERNPFDQYSDAFDPIKKEKIDKLISLERDIKSAVEHDNLYNELIKKGKVKQGEIIVEAPYGGLGIYNPATNKYRNVDYDWNNSIVMDSPHKWTDPNPPVTYVVGKDKSLLDKKFKYERLKYNTEHQFDDDFIDYKDYEQYIVDLDKASEEFINSMNGPFFEDIMGYDR